MISSRFAALSASETFFRFAAALVGFLRAFLGGSGSSSSSSGSSPNSSSSTSSSNSSSSSSSGSSGSSSSSSSSSYSSSLSSSSSYKNSNNLKRENTTTAGITDQANHWQTKNPCTRSKQKIPFEFFSSASFPFAYELSVLQQSVPSAQS